MLCSYRRKRLASRYHGELDLWDEATHSWAKAPGQRLRWHPPGLRQAKKVGDKYVVAGHKKWITNGIWADYFTTAVRTGPACASICEAGSTARRQSSFVRFQREPIFDLDEIVDDLLDQSDRVSTSR